jgi:hypothetical protein
MRGLFLAAWAAWMSGCASPTVLADRARAHERAAERALYHGDPTTAAREREAAGREWDRANARASGWGMSSQAGQF